jgi:hypothetical protein
LFSVLRTSKMSRSGLDLLKQKPHHGWWFNRTPPCNRLWIVILVLQVLGLFLQAELQQSAGPHRY